jgi:acyl dehydratase
MIGAGVEEMRWTKPVRPGDKIRTRTEILHTRPLTSRPTYGLVRSLTTVYNQRDEVVMTSITNFLAPLKGASTGF